VSVAVSRRTRDERCGNTVGLGRAEVQTLVVRAYRLGGDITSQPVDTALEVKLRAVTRSVVRAIVVRASHGLRTGDRGRARAGRSRITLLQVIKLPSGGASCDGQQKRPGDLHVECSCQTLDGELMLQVSVDVKIFKVT